MNRFWQVVLKILTVEAVAFSVLPLAGVGLNATMWFGLILAALSYVGDVFLLPVLGNAWAAVADAGLAFVVALLVPGYLGFGLRMGAALSLAILTGIAEWWFHRYVMGRRENVRRLGGPESRH